MSTGLVGLDTAVSLWLQGFASVWPDVWKIVAIFGVYAIPATLLWSWLWGDKPTAVRATVAGLGAWLGMNTVISHFIPRDRPSQLPFLHFPAHEFVFDRPGPSFPSDHAALMVAVAVAFAASREQKIAVFLGSVAAATLLARIVTAQHWAGDIVAGAAVGVVTAQLTELLRDPLDRYLVQPLVRSWARIVGPHVRTDA